jgi:hypothetical protein
MIRKISVRDANGSLQIIAKDLDTKEDFKIMDTNFRQIQPYFMKKRGKQEAIISISLGGEHNFEYAIEIDAKRVTEDELDIFRILIDGLIEQIHTNIDIYDKLVQALRTRVRKETIQEYGNKLELEVTLHGLFEIAEELLDLKEAK